MIALPVWIDSGNLHYLFTYFMIPGNPTEVNHLIRVEIRYKITYRKFLYWKWQSVLMQSNQKLLISAKLYYSHGRKIFITLILENQKCKQNSYASVKKEKTEERVICNLQVNSRLLWTFFNLYSTRKNYKYLIEEFVSNWLQMTFITACLFWFLLTLLRLSCVASVNIKLLYWRCA